ncbi:MAG: murein hydrolase activator EnvC family protein [Patescibacteria group bacterium]
MSDHLFIQPKRRKRLKVPHTMRIAGFFVVLLVITSIGAFIHTQGLLWAHGHDSVDDLNEAIDDKRAEIEEIDAQIKQYKSQIESKRKEALTLQNQIDILDAQKEATLLEINKLEIRTNQIELEIIANEHKIEELALQQVEVKHQVAELLREIQKEDDKTYLEIVLLYDNISEFFNHITYLENVEEGLQTDLDHLQRLTENLTTEQSNLLTRKNNLVAIKKKLEEEKAKLDSQQYAKNVLLDQTKSSERQYQQLIAEQRSLQDSINSEIVSLEQQLRSKLAESEQLQNISEQGLMWPVPSRYITAGFHDTDYPFRHIFEHPAIDVRASQGTPVRAAASGYVGRAKNAGLGYSYIMLVHADGVSTVYGHMSQINVKEDTYVVQGEVIGLSGGMPGTPGAGRLTTGPHLHFEVRVNGVPVNPVQYLP